MTFAPLRLASLLVALLALALAAAPAASAKGKKDDGKDKHHKHDEHCKHDHDDDRDHDKDDRDRGPHGKRCCDRVAELEREIERLERELDHCRPARPCPRERPCPTRDFPCVPNPGHPCDKHPQDGCVRSQGYWKNHQPWPASGRLCGRSWQAILDTPPRGDAWVILAHQWIAASLNRAAGADPPPEIARALRDGERLLDGCSIDSSERARALAIKDLLDRWNNGSAGTEKCN